MNTSLTGRVALITGASSGIGRAISLSLAELGVQLALCSRSGHFPDIPNSFNGQVDVRDYQQVDAFVKNTVDHFGRLDIIVANAGVGFYADFVDTDPEVAKEMLETNAIGTVNVYRAGVPWMLKNGSGGDLVTIASVAGLHGFPGEAVYCASKFAQVGLTRALDNELRPKGIRCSCICPGGVHTEFAMQEGRGRSHDDANVSLMMEADDVARSVTFVLQQPASMRIMEIALRPMSETSGG